MSRLASFLGILLGVVLLASTMFDYQQQSFISAFLNWQALLLVLGGTFAAALINYPLNQVVSIFPGIYKVFATESRSDEELITEIFDLATLAKRKGPLAIENQLTDVEDKFFRHSLNEMLLYQDAEKLRSSLQTRLMTNRLQDLNSQEVFINMASYSPAFGMMGTVMGLIVMMTTQINADMYSLVAAQSNDMLSGLLHGMGLALVTTFYGVLLANLLFLPIAGKLKVLGEQELLRNEMIIHAVVAMKAQESPLLIKEQLKSFVHEKTQQRLGEMA
ncbi:MULTISPECIES: motility protein A [Thiomicrorhabdus]|uniref:MotA/TolQ/ExbB proton channel family protein n=1 Tax=Thiomicrorhabdus xiamenensis TaxID=2739063 RepID=A0A7D4NPX2_9GAMM|nr:MULTISPECIES: MotA/TolQ/ExbB proton channel family protein [Thiomicrorhabdus]MBO1923171.1 MotA/TolQ/ExbB proton channel family protein [Thiomicrorhabdus sp. 6S3-12]QKI89953.1 MotA/TolQ/ExbB proton channel family protein [Thiomicrorhabdus xiamenensis]